MQPKKRCPLNKLLYVLFSVSQSFRFDFHEAPIILGSATRKARPRTYQLLKRELKERKHIFFIARVLDIKND